MKDYLFYGEGGLTTSGLDAHIFCKSSVAIKDKLKSNDLQLVTMRIGDNTDQDESMENAEKLFNYDWENPSNKFWLNAEMKNKSFDRNTISNSAAALILNVRPKSVGSLTLKSSNPYDSPIIDPNYMSDENNDDLQIFLDGWNKLIEIYQSDICKSYGCEIIEFEKFKNNKEMAMHVAKNNIATIYHPVGTCKMGNVEKDKM